MDGCHRDDPAARNRVPFKERWLKFGTAIRLKYLSKAEVSKYLDTSAWHPHREKVHIVMFRSTLRVA